MFTIAKRFQFSAAHFQPQLPKGHKCTQVHGHNYEVEVELSARELNELSMVRELGDLRPFKVYLDSVFDHKCINDFLFPTSVEYLAKHFFDWCHKRWPEVSSVTVWENPKLWSRYTLEATR